MIYTLYVHVSSYYKRIKILFSPLVYPYYIGVLHTYTMSFGSRSSIYYCRFGTNKIVFPLPSKPLGAAETLNGFYFRSTIFILICGRMCVCVCVSVNVNLRICICISVYVCVKYNKWQRYNEFGAFDKAQAIPENLSKHVNTFKKNVSARETRVAFKHVSKRRRRRIIDNIYPCIWVYLYRFTVWNVRSACVLWRNKKYKIKIVTLSRVEITIIYNYTIEPETIGGENGERKKPVETLMVDNKVNESPERDLYII